MTDLSEDTLVETLKQSQRLYENNNNSINAAQPLTSNALCDVWRAQTRAAQKQKKQGAYNSAHLQSMLLHDRATVGGDSNVETKHCFLTTTRSNLLHGTPRNQQT